MDIRLRRYCVAGVALAVLLACTTDEDDPGGEADDSTASTTSSSNTTGSGGTTSTGTKCSRAITLTSSTPLIADFDDYDGATAPADWSFPLGDDPALGIQAGPFVYGDDHLEGDQDVPETSEMVDGNDSDYALSISDTEAEDYGGGMGIWMSECVDASTFDGVSLSVRGNAPAGTIKLSLLMEETTLVADEGTCEGTADTCVHPSATFDLTDDWTEVEVPWSDFTGGKVEGVDITADGSNIWQIQIDIGLAWTDDDGDGVYDPTPAPYELVVDDLSFY